ncbi:uncharacterized protein LOC109141461 [Larimichthys crocea]|uniref:uncharacterized protein LOC109141461 n=1 Tax=Larimichthys crocea TaxID=215358 RepID=UPI000901EF2F|nr:uncharacterized protein LOC109141461 [Larimichthys crocea]
MPGKCSFNSAWLSKESYQQWLARDGDQGRARCKFCMKSFDVSNMGEAALVSHLKGKKHQVLASATNRLAITDFMTTVTTERPSTSSVVLSAATKQSTISSDSKNEVLKAEILWALKVMNSHYSFKSSEDTSKLFGAMFPDSEIAKRFACGERKCAYMCTFGIAPHFKKLLLSEVSSQTTYVMLFDESLNHHLQSKQMDLHVRLWDGAEVKTKYIGSEFLGHSTAIDLVEKISNALAETGVKNLIQLSMDGHDCPARHEDFVTATGCSTVMLKFCKHRWLENVTVTDRALKLWPYVQIYVERVLRGELPNPKTKSFETVKNSTKDCLFIPKVMIFNSIAREITPFLTLYQTDKPMLPFPERGYASADER